MFNSMYNGLLEWNRTNDDRQKLQHVFLVIAILSVVLAGLVSLIDPVIGQDILVVTLVSGGIFLINAVIWSLVESAVIARLSGRRKKQ
jgi:hypothetical protein